jgi:hypothetical protein
MVTSECPYQRSRMIKRLVFTVSMGIALFSASCERDDPIQPPSKVTPPSPSTYQFKGAVYRSRFDTDPTPDTTVVPASLRSLTPIRATIKLDGKDSLQSDSSWFCSFDFRSVAKGKHSLHIDSTRFSVSLDTTFVIDHDAVCGSAAGTYRFVVTAIPPPPIMYQFRGGVYRSRFDFEPIPDVVTLLPPFFQPLTPISTTITLDGKQSLQSSSSWSCGIDFCCLPAGTHTLHIDSTQYSASLDTTFTVDHDGGCYPPSGYSFLVKAVPPPLREFLFPHSPGTRWLYQYNYSYSDAPTGYRSTRNGIHAWTVRSTTSSGSTETILVDDIRSDSVHAWGNYVRDTTYLSSDTVQFSVSQSASSIVVSFPNRALGSRFQSIPRFHDYGSDTLTLRTTIYDTPVTGSATYISEIGLSRFTISQSSNHPYAESMSLITMQRP